MILALLLLAVPADARLVLQPSVPHIEKIDAGALEVATEGALQAEILPSGNELLLEPRGPGLSRAFVFYSRQVRVLEIAAGRALEAPLPQPACTPIADAACYAQWRAFLSTASAPVQLTLDGLQAEARAAQELLAAAGLGQVVVSLSPFGVKLRGARDEGEGRRALRAIYPAVLGPLRIDR